MPTMVFLEVESSWVIVERLEVPLQGKRRVNEERLVVVGVVDEVVADLNLTTKAQVLVGVVPQLGFGEDDELTMTIGIFTTPEIDEAREGERLAEVQAPDTRELEAVVGRGVLIALEITLVHQLYRVGLREVGTMTIPGTTEEG